MIHRDQTWRFVEDVERAGRETQVEALLLRLAARYGFSSIFGGFVPRSRVTVQEVRSRTLFHRLPEEWSTRYSSRGYLFRDPVYRRLQFDREAFSWAEAYASCTCRPDVTLIQGEASEFGLCSGYVLPISLLDGTVVAVSFGARDCDLSPEARAVLGFAASYAVGNLVHRRARRGPTQPALTARETECLLWAAEGKTDWEIATILGISKPTVAKHIISARGKLGAVTKGHAIAVAFRSRLIR